MIDRLQLVVRTPQRAVVDELVRSARVPSETGLVGLRPRQEPMLLAIEPGLVLYRTHGAVHLAATAGGLLESDTQRAVLYTPFTVVGEHADELLDALDDALSTPDSELAIRHRLGELEERIVQELRHGRGAARRRDSRA